MGGEGGGGAELTQKTLVYLGISDKQVEEEAQTKACGLLCFVCYHCDLTQLSPGQCSTVAFYQNKLPKNPYAQDELEESSEENNIKLLHCNPDQLKQH